MSSRVVLQQQRIRVEAKMMEAWFGDQYARYRQGTKRLVVGLLTVRMP